MLPMLVGLICLAIVLLIPVDAILPSGVPILSHSGTSELFPTLNFKKKLEKSVVLFEFSSALNENPMPQNIILVLYVPTDKSIKKDYYQLYFEKNGDSCSRIQLFGKKHGKIEDRTRSRHINDETKLKIAYFNALRSTILLYIPAECTLTLVAATRMIQLKRHQVAPDTSISLFSRTLNSFADFPVAPIVSSVCYFPMLRASPPVVAIATF